MFRLVVPSDACKSGLRLLALVSVLTAAAATGQTMTHMRGHYDSSRIVELLNKKQACFFWAFGSITAPVFGPGRTAKGRPFCVFDGVSGRGTINEQSGCMAGVFDVETGSYEPLFRGEILTVRGRCSTNSALLLMAAFDRGGPLFEEVRLELLRAKTDRAVKDNMSRMLAHFLSDWLLFRQVSGEDVLAEQYAEKYAPRVHLGGTGPVRKISAELQTAACTFITRPAQDALGCKGGAGRTTSPNKKDDSNGVQSESSPRRMDDSIREEQRPVFVPAHLGEENENDTDSVPSDTPSKNTTKRRPL